MVEQEFYELVSKWRPEPLPPFGMVFMHKGVEYTIIGINKAGNKIRARSAAGVFLFKAKHFYQEYKVKKPNDDNT